VAGKPKQKIRKEAIMATQTQKDIWSQEELDKAWLEYINRQPFSYDPAEDPAYHRYRDRYVTEGRLAMEDTVGKVTALTGGYGNSYAQTAGQQSYQQYLKRLGDVLPELYGNAYDRYQAEGEALYKEIRMRQEQLDRLAQEEAEANSGSGGSSGGGGSGYSSGGYTKAEIMAAQQLVGATADGIWGPESTAKAARYGFTSLKSVIENGLTLSYDYVKKAMKKQLGHDLGVISEYDFLVARNNDGGPEKYLKYKDYRAYLLDVLQQIYA
jgi:hypothetical protein